MDQAIETASRAGIGVVAMKVMAGGFKDVKPSDPLYSKLKRTAPCSPRSSGPSKPTSPPPFPGMTDMDQLDENLQAMAIPSRPATKRACAHLEAIKPLYCRMCGQCDGACQQGLPVADVLRITHRYADGYRQFALGGEIPGLPPRIAPSVAAICAACTRPVPARRSCAGAHGASPGAVCMKTAACSWPFWLPPRRRAPRRPHLRLAPDGTPSGTKRSYAADNLFDYKRRSRRLSPSASRT